MAFCDSYSPEYQKTIVITEWAVMALRLLLAAFGVFNFVAFVRCQQEYKKTATLSIFYIMSISTLLTGAALSFMLTYSWQDHLLILVTNVVHFYTILGMLITHMASVYELNSCLKIVIQVNERCDSGGDFNKQYRRRDSSVCSSAYDIRSFSFQSIEEELS